MTEVEDIINVPAEMDQKNVINGISFLINQSEPFSIFSVKYLDIEHQFKVGDKVFS
jgi:hypothetical protein